MQADFAVELGRDDPTLTVPWEDPDGEREYLDLKRQPDLLAKLAEAIEYPELRDLLAFLNSASSSIETAKCDVWWTTEMNPDEDIFHASWKFGSYVDFLFSDRSSRSCFAAHEKLVRDLVQLLRKAPEIPASAEFLIRRCYYDRERNEDGEDNFYVTFYVFGYGDAKVQARKQWVIALRLVENAIRQRSAGA